MLKLFLRGNFCRVAVFSLLLYGAVATLPAQNAPECITTLDKPQQPGTAVLSNSYTAITDTNLYHFILQQVKPQTRVVMLGEQHWMQAISELGTHLTCLLNERHNFRNLLLEYPYSYTAFINAYLAEAPGSGNSLLEVISSVFDTQEKIAQLQFLQRWNAEHPGRPIRVLCTDFEQDYTFPVVQVLLPYFRDFGDTTFITHLRKVQNVDDHLLFLADSLLAQIPADFTARKYSFLTKQYVTNTFQNLQSAYQGRQFLVNQGEAAGFADFMKIRTARSIQNLEDENIFGAFIRADKSIFWGGENHIRYPSKVPRKNVRNEGEYLFRKFNKQAFAIGISVLGYQVPASYYPEPVTTDLSSYNMLVAAYQQCFPAFDPRQYLLIEDLNPVTRWVLTNMQASGNTVTLVPARQNSSLKKLSLSGEIDPDFQEVDFRLFIKESALFTHQ
ncbi:MAG: erythromycin esterase family protein [Lewinellaceae bacterium]|nr:erythromycin esterase family protein [Lewinellaceae bacterium]